MPKYDNGYGDDDMPDKPDSEQQHPDEEGEATALLDKSILGGKDWSVGDEIVLKIVHLYDSQVEVVYSKGDDKEEKPKRSAMQDSEEAMDRMSTTET